MDANDQPIADLIGHEIEITTLCGCTRVVVFSPECLIDRIGPDVTLRIARARLLCRQCRQRPELWPGLRWGVSESRDTRVDPAPLPGWVIPMIRRSPQS